MYLVMFLNVAEFSHIYNSITRFYVTTLMIAAMITMLISMWKCIQIVNQCNDNSLSLLHF
jgi:hypothetical protein